MCDYGFIRRRLATTVAHRPWPAVVTAAILAFSPASAQDAAQDDPLLESLLPEALQELEVLGLSAWQWIGAVALLVGALVASWVLTFLGYRVALRLARRTETKIDDRLLPLSVRPVRYVLALGLFAVGALFLRLPPSIQDALTKIEKALGIVILAWLVLRLIDLAAEIVRERLEEQERLALLTVIPLGRKVAKVGLFLLGMLAVLQNLGFHVTGLVAGLGVGGLAVALAAQKTVENLFGGATLLADRPVRVGDVCRFGDKMGTVEEIGLRSTRVRSLDRTMITVPNADFSQMALENFGARDRVRLLHTLGLRYETTPDQLRHVLVGLRKVLHAHPMVEPEPARVRFVGFGAYSLDLEVMAFVRTRDYAVFLAVREDILLRFMDVVEQSGTGFAFPSQTTYLARDGGLDAERSEAARAEIRAWREAGTLPFPEFSPEAVQELDDTLDWPPQGAMTQPAG